MNYFTARWLSSLAHVSDIGLVVNQNGTNAQFKGIGTVNGVMDPNGNPYKFQIWAGDGSGDNGADTFRIRIWWEDAAGEQVVYDNGAAQAIGGRTLRLLSHPFSTTGL